LVRHCGDERRRPIRERETFPRFAANRHPLQTDYFAANWAKYENAVPGTIRIAPNEQLRKVLRDDYIQMKEMLPVDALTFDQILERLDTLEKRLNSLAPIAR
jgi:hypothetical protein